MIDFIIPKNYAGLLPTDNQVASEALNRIIEGLIHKNFEKITLTKKNFGTRTVYTLNVNASGSHRLIFEKATLITSDTASMDVYILRSIALHHEYRKALTGTWEPIAIDDSGYFWPKHTVSSVGAADSPTTKSIEEIEETSKDAFYGEQWITLTDEQSTSLTTTLPCLTVGPPGSGKSVLCLTSLQHRVIKYMEDLKSIREAAEAAAETTTALNLLYVSPQSRLNESMRTKWDAWVIDNIPDGDRHLITLDFKTCEELLVSPPTEAAADAHTVPAQVNEHYQTMSNIRTAMKNAGIREGRADATTLRLELYHEFRLASYVLNADLKAGHDFHGSDYKKLGVAQSTLDIAQREIAYRVFTQLKRLMIGDAIKPMIIIPGISDSLAITAQYDYTCFDEIQSATVQDCLNAMAATKNKAILYVGDHYQRGEEPISIIESLRSYYFKITSEKTSPAPLPLSIVQLSATHRLSPAAAHLCNQLVLLANHMREGKDAIAYTSLHSQEMSGREITPINFTEFIPSATAVAKPNYKEDATILCIILTDDDRDAAAELFGTDKVFLADDVRGLEFKKVAIYISATTAAEFGCVAARMMHKVITAGTELGEITSKPAEKSLSDHKREFATVSQLMVAISRSCGEVWVFWPTLTDAQKHRIQVFYDWLKVHCSGTKLLEAKASSPEEWLGLVNSYLQDSSQEAATRLLQEKFTLSADQISQCVEKYRAEHPITIDVITEIKQPKPTTAPLPTAEAIAKEESQVAETPSKRKKKEKTRDTTATRTPPATPPRAAPKPSATPTPKAKTASEVADSFIKKIDFALSGENKKSIRRIITAIYGGYDKTITDPNPLHNLLSTEEGQTLIFSIIKNHKYCKRFLEKIEPSVWIKSFRTSSITSTPLSYFFIGDTGLELVNKNFDYFAPCFTQNVLKETESLGISIFSMLCIGYIADEGIEFITQHWDTINPLIDAEMLTTASPTMYESPLFAFCEKPTGRKLLSDRFGFFKGLLVSHEDWVKPASRGPLRGIPPLGLLLCSDPCSLNIVIENFDYFKPCFTKDFLKLAIKEISIFSWLCSSLQGIILISNNWEDVFKPIATTEILTKKITVGPNTDKTPLDLLKESQGPIKALSKPGEESEERKRVRAHP